MKEIDGVAVSNRGVQESQINEINAEEDSGEKGGESAKRWKEAAGGGGGVRRQGKRLIVL